MGIGEGGGWHQLLNLGGHQALLAIAAVVGHDVKMVTYCLHFLFEKEQVSGACTDDDVSGDAQIMSPFHLGIDRCDAHSARHEQQAHLAALLGGGGDQLAGATQRPDDGVEAVAFFQKAEAAGAFTHHLVHDADAFALRVYIADGQRHPLPLVNRDNDDKLSGKSAAGNPRRMDFHQINTVAVEKLFL